MIRPVHYAVLILAMALPGMAAAQNAASPAKHEAVPMADLDLSRQAGVEVLIARLQAASQRVCGPAPAIAAIGLHRLYRACVKETMDRAVAAIDAPLVAKVYTGMEPQILARN